MNPRTSGIISTIKICGTAPTQKKHTHQKDTAHTYSSNARQICQGLDKRINCYEEPVGRGREKESKSLKVGGARVGRDLEGKRAFVKVA